MKIIIDENYLIVKDNPWLYWIFYFIFFIAGTLCLFMATTKSPNQTTFFIASFIGIAHIAISVSMIMHSSASIIVFDKEKQAVNVCRSHILRKKLTTFRFGDLKFIQITHEKDSDGDPICKAIIQTKDDEIIYLSHFRCGNHELLEKITDEISLFTGIKNIDMTKKNIKLTIEYDGTKYYGWQIQANAPTIQQALKDAVFALTSENVTITGSGRTDTGVHARNQVANFFTESKINPFAFCRALNAKLPKDIVVKKSEEVALEFHSQFQAKAKAYSYRILCCPEQPAIERNYVHWVWTPLEFKIMQEASIYLLGTHDFSSFESANSPRKSSIRTINKVDIVQDNCYITILIEANGFLYKMVRNIVGTLIEFGQKKHIPQKMQEILEAKNRNFAGNTAPAKGLFLEYVLY